MKNQTSPPVLCDSKTYAPSLSWDVPLKIDLSHILSFTVIEDNFQETDTVFSLFSFRFFPQVFPHFSSRKQETKLAKNYSAEEQSLRSALESKL